MPYPDNGTSGFRYREDLEDEANRYEREFSREAEEILPAALTLLRDFQARWRAIPELRHEDQTARSYYASDFAEQIQDQISWVEGAMVVNGLSVPS